MRLSFGARHLASDTQPPKFSRRLCLLKLNVSVLILGVRSPEPVNGWDGWGTRGSVGKNLAARLHAHDITSQR